MNARPSGSADRSTAAVTAGAVGTGTVVTLAVGFSRSSLAPPSWFGGGAFFVVATLTTTLLTFALVYGRRIAPRDLPRRGTTAVLIGVAGATFAFTMASILSGTFDPEGVPTWVPVVGVALAVLSFVAMGAWRAHHQR